MVRSELSVTGLTFLCVTGGPESKEIAKEKRGRRFLPLFSLLYASDNVRYIIEYLSKVFSVNSIENQSRSY